MSVKIHGNEYVTVAERLQMAKEETTSITTEVLQHSPLVVVKATVVTKKGTFTGTSAANPNKSIEKQSPYEVAETSAVGRALGFAGYGATESIATAEEVTYATKAQENPGYTKDDNNEIHLDVSDKSADLGKCVKCGAPNALSQAGNRYCSAKCWMK